MGVVPKAVAMRQPSSSPKNSARAFHSLTWRVLALTADAWSFAVVVPDPHGPKHPPSRNAIPVVVGGGFTPPQATCHGCHMTLALGGNGCAVVMATCRLHIGWSRLVHKPCGFERFRKRTPAQAVMPRRHAGRGLTRRRETATHSWKRPGQAMPSRVRWKP